MAARQIFRVGSGFKIDGNFSLHKLRSRHQGVLNCASARMVHSSRPLLKKEEVTITFEKGDKAWTVKGREGDSILDVFVKNEKELGFVGYGACEGTLSCSTCHIILSEEDIARLPHKPTDEELDMLDLAPNACDTSRLGCQIFLTKKMDGLRVKLPSFRVDLRENPGQIYQPVKND